jgi:hypothetical protein
MSNLARILQNYSAAICRDQRRVEELRRALEPFLFDGSECFRTINAELSGPEHEIAASNIRHANLAQFCGCAPIDIILEVVGKLLDEGKLP